MPLDSPTAAFWISVASATVASVIGGLALLSIQNHLMRRARRASYEKVRRKLASDLFFNLRVVRFVWQVSQAPYHKASGPVFPGYETSDSSEIRINGYQRYRLHFETWHLARPHLIAMADNPDDGLRMARAFQFFHDCIAQPDVVAGTIMPRLLKGPWEPGTLLQPTGMLKGGYQFAALPREIHAIFGNDEARRFIARIVADFAPDDEADEVANLLIGWGGSSWHGVGNGLAWVPSEYTLGGPLQVVEWPKDEHRAILTSEADV